MNDTQRQIVCKLVELLLEAGYVVSARIVDQYEELNDNIDDTLTRMGRKGKDTLQIYRPCNPARVTSYVGQIILFYDTQPGVTLQPDVIPAIEPIIDQTMEFAANLTAEATS